ncbi:glycosyltransferase family 4 protein [Pedobacter heparinus]|uniref:Glycosyl transferase group 1 n=1 Tax=Pedobacter heparinus (strain ATCC 13125 / DSM 2366 / CIP 104194 / JCM 7457 / NBRC 12017 / NCIMB 9290 / NRRL B-14731 / HIM 762-3) TaxID=485917 RepID=C6XVK9_PEDHD|nr:glycosyltransferase family 4 protein [Pedobacter heparinus]ACU06084.1 glycosyl transferase group 1 [Pedobacter heparinus DSM 2366]
MSKKILLLTLETFCATGGIQKMGRILAYGLQQLGAKHKWEAELYSLCDRKTDLMPEYLAEEKFKAFRKNRLKFMWESIKAGKKADLVILSHINLSVLGWAIYLLNPNCQIWLIAHGIEVWRPLRLWKKSVWKICSKVICVSRYTQEKVIALHQVAPEQCTVVNNAVDPFITFPEHFHKPGYLLERYELNTDQKIVFTLARISVTEQYKGYDQVIKALGNLGQNNIQYVLAGPYDEAEKLRLTQLASQYGLGNNFILPGYIKAEELADHFLLADLFVLPSKKEGFGIVFIEAMAFGLPIICGNADGSVDAVKNQEMGTAIDPDDIGALEQAILRNLGRTLSIGARKSIQQQCLKYFSQQHYLQTLERLIKNEACN